MIKIGTPSIKKHVQKISLSLLFTVSVVINAQNNSSFFQQTFAEFERQEQLPSGRFLATQVSAEQATIVSENNPKENNNIVCLDHKQELIDNILNQAFSFLGTPYRMGGNNRSGMDCSAFVISAFQGFIPLELPRLSSGQSALGEPVDNHNLKRGDLLFFQTRGRRISHVGIVHEIDTDGKIKFIHASSSRGVSISSLNETYWQNKYSFAKRVIQ
jgi:cell wall-associated NlpC family hydrolase